MHVKLLLVISGLAQHAFAFIPYKHKTNVGLDRENVDHHSVRRSNRLRPFEQKAHVKRENDFNIDIASTPSQPNSVGINYDEAGDLYFVAAKFGTSDKVYQLLIDTGATESWIMGSSCEAKACSLHTTLGPKDSTTLKACQMAMLLNIILLTNQRFLRIHSAKLMDRAVSTVRLPPMTSKLLALKCLSLSGSYPT